MIIGWAVLWVAIILLFGVLSVISKLGKPLVPVTGKVAASYTFFTACYIAVLIVAGVTLLTL